VTAPPSRLTERVRIDQPAGAPDGAGGRDGAYTPLAMIFAALTPQGAGAAQVAAARAAHLTWRAEIRWRGDIRPGQRLVWGERLLPIEAVIDDGRRRRLVLLCREEEFQQ